MAKYLQNYKELMSLSQQSQDNSDIKANCSSMANLYADAFEKFGCQAELSDSKKRSRLIG